jgi:enoyl-CoA hydratase/carnithine racemase
MTRAYGDHVTVDLEGHVALVEFSNPPNNFVTVPMMTGMADALEALDADPQCRAVVLASAGKAFCAGADLAAAKGVGGSGMTGVSPLYHEAVRLFSTGKPIIAAVQGAAVGAGLGLALVADYRVASPEARFAANFVKLGFHPGFGLTHTLPRLIGQQRASLMFLTGRRIKAEDGLAWGLVDQVAPAESLREAAFALAGEIAENAPLAVVATRKTLREGLAEAVRKHTDHELEQQTILRVTEDFAEGVRAVNERRPGRFVGR